MQYFKVQDTFISSNWLKTFDNRADAIDSSMAETSPYKKDQFTETNWEPKSHAGIIIKPPVTHFNFGKMAGEISNQRDSHCFFRFKIEI